jgi:hypothetical protein
MSQINSELGLFVVPGRAATDSISLDETEVRWLASKITANSPVVIPDDFWGKGYYELTADVTELVESTFSAVVLNPALVLDQTVKVGTLIPIGVTGGVAPYTYSVSPSLPVGLQFNTTTGAITNATPVVLPVTTYTMTVTESGGASATATFTITVRAGIPGTAFFNASFEDSPLVLSGDTYTTNGWIVYARQVRLNGLDNILGFPTPNDSTTPATIAAGTGTAGDNITSTMTFTATMDPEIPPGGGTVSLRMVSTGTIPAGFGIVHGPYAISTVDVIVEDGDEVEFWWQAKGGGDAYDIFAYLIDINSGKTIELLNDTGSDGAAVVLWTRVLKTITASDEGTYKFVFISGSWDASGGQFLGASLYVDNISVLRTKPLVVKPPTYSFTSVPSSVNEGADASFSIATTNVPNGTKLYWVLSYTGITTPASNADFTKTSDEFTITGGTGSFTVPVASDLLPDSAESFKVGIRTVLTDPTTEVVVSSAVSITNIPVIPSVVLTGPACIDSATNDAVALTATFSIAVTGFTTSAIDPAMLAAFRGLAPTTITAVSPTVYTITAARSGIPYSILNRRTANLLGSTGLTQLAQNLSSNISYSAGDESAVSITLPFNVAFPSTATTLISGTTIWVTSNSGIYLSSVDQGTGFPVSLTNPPAPAIYIGASDAGLFNLYGGAENGGTTYRIRWEGVGNYTQGTSPTAINKIWEATFYASDPRKFSIDISPTWVGGTSLVKNNSVQLYDLSTEVASNRGFDVSYAYQAQIPAGYAQSPTLTPNTISNLLTLLPC